MIEVLKIENPEEELIQELEEIKARLEKERKLYDETDHKES